MNNALFNLVHTLLEYHSRAIGPRVPFTSLHPIRCRHYPAILPLGALSYQMRQEVRPSIQERRDIIQQLHAEVLNRTSTEKHIVHSDRSRGFYNLQDTMLIQIRQNQRKVKALSGGAE